MCIKLFAAEVTSLLLQLIGSWYGIVTAMQIIHYL